MQWYHSLFACDLACALPLQYLQEVRGSRHLSRACQALNQFVFVRIKQSTRQPLERVMKWQIVVTCARYTGKSRAFEVWRAAALSFKLIMNTVNNRSMSCYMIYILIFR